MKTIIGLLVIILISMSCKKNTDTCYNCSYGTINGYTPPDDTYCGPMPYVKVVNGNEVNTFCTPK